MTTDVGPLITRARAELGAALGALHVAYAELDGARTKEQQSAARKKLRSARDDLGSALACYIGLRQIDALGLL